MASPTDEAVALRAVQAEEPPRVVRVLSSGSPYGMNRHGRRAIEAQIRRAQKHERSKP